jgi:hypothetical protein
MRRQLRTIGWMFVGDQGDLSTGSGELEQVVKHFAERSAIRPPWPDLARRTAAAESGTL